MKSLAAFERAMKFWRLLMVRSWMPIGKREHYPTTTT